MRTSWAIGRLRREWGNKSAVPAVTENATAQANNPPPVWWHAETLSLAYEEAKERQGEVASWSDALDTKAMAVFGVGTVIMGLSPALISDTAPRLAVVPWALAMLCWVLSVVFCWTAYAVRGYRASPDVAAMLRSPKWCAATLDEYKQRRMIDMAEDHVYNTRALDKKAAALRLAIIFTSVAVGLLTATAVGLLALENYV